MTVAQLQKALSLERLTEGDPDRQVTGGYCGDLLSWVMGRAREGDAWMTVMGNVNAVAVAVLAAGALASARLWLGCHTIRQVAAGYAGGFIVATLAVLLL